MPDKTKTAMTLKDFLEEQFEFFLEAQREINELVEIQAQVMEQSWENSEVGELLSSFLIKKIRDLTDKRKEAIDTIKSNL